MNARRDLFPSFLFIVLFMFVFPHSPRNVLRFDEMMSMTFLVCRQSATDEGNIVLPGGRPVCCEESPPALAQRHSDPHSDLTWYLGTLLPLSDVSFPREP